MPHTDGKHQRHTLSEIHLLPLSVGLYHMFGARLFGNRSNDTLGYPYFDIGLVADRVNLGISCFALLLRAALLQIKILDHGVATTLAVRIGRPSDCKA